MRVLYSTSSHPDKKQVSRYPFFDEDFFYIEMLSNVSGELSIFVYDEIVELSEYVTTEIKRKNGTIIFNKHLISPIAQEKTPLCVLDQFVVSEAHPSHISIPESIYQADNLAHSENVSRVLKNLAPELVAIFPTHVHVMLAAAQAEKLGIPWIMFEVGFFPEYAAIDTRGMHHFPDHTEINERWPLFQDQQDICAKGEQFRSNLVAQRTSREHQQSSPQIKADIARFCQASRCLLVSGQVLKDVSVAVSSREFAGIPGFLDAVVTNLPPGWKAIVKPHPLEPTDFGHLASDRVMVCPELAIHDAFDLADAVCVLNSNVGLEAALAGKAVIVCGYPHYRGKGFTIDVTTASQLRDSIARSLEFSPSMEIVDNYVGYLITDYLVHYKDFAGLERKMARAIAQPVVSQDPFFMFAKSFPPIYTTRLQFVYTFQQQVREGLSLKEPAKVLHMKPEFDVLSLDTAAIIEQNGKSKFQYGSILKLYEKQIASDLHESMAHAGLGLPSRVLVLHTVTGALPRMLRIFAGQDAHITALQNPQRKMTIIRRLRQKLARIVVQKASPFRFMCDTPSGSFDFVLLVDFPTLEQDSVIWLAEIVRVLAPGGIFLADTSTSKAYQIFDSDFPLRPLSEGTASPASTRSHSFIEWHCAEKSGS